MGKVSSAILSLLVAAFLASAALPIAQAQLFRSSTDLSLSPSSFEINSGESITLTARLTSDGDPLSGYAVTFTIEPLLLGSLDKYLGITDSNGQVSVTYTAPLIETPVTITARFLGDLQYLGSTASSSGTVAKAPTTLTITPSNFTLSSEDSTTLIATLTSEGSPLAGKSIEFVATLGSTSPIIGSTDHEGKVSITYTAPMVLIQTSVEIAAVFAGDFEYEANSATSSGTVEPKPILAPTNLGLSPPTFTVSSENSISLTTTLTSDGTPLADKPILFVAIPGSLSPIVGTTDAQGQASVTYTAPVAITETPVTITATFAGDLDYQPSSASSSGTIVPIELLSPTELTLTPSSFTVSPENSITLTATLTSDGAPLAGKLIEFVAIPGIVDPLVGTTNSEGKVTATYTAPAVIVQTPATVTATFAGDFQYEPATTSSSGTIEPIEIELLSPTELTLTPSSFTVSPENSITLTATLTSDGAPLAGKLIEFVAIPGIVDPLVGTTNSEGKVTATYTAPEIFVDTPVEIVATFLGDFEYLGNTATSTGTIEAEAILPIIRKEEGAAFCIPESVKDDISNFAISIPEEIQSLLPVPVPTTGFLLVNRENLSLVLAQESDKGLASVEGWAITPEITLGGFELSVIVARSVSFVKDGTPASIGEILVNPGGYEFELVKISATRRHISILYDPDDGSGIEFPITAGYLVEEPEAVPELVKNAIRRGKELILNASRGIVQGIVIKERERLPVFDFETDYWVDCPVETNGIVLLPGSRILRLLENVVPEVGELIQIETDLPVLYDVETTLLYEEVSSVGEINLNPDEYRGKVVGFSANGFGGAISIQEAFEEEGYYIPVDVCLEGLIAWNTLSIPPAREELLVAAGASSTHQDDIFLQIEGEFRFIGRIVSTKQIDESLPEALALIVYYRERVGDIDYEGLARVAKECIENKLLELNFVLTKVPTRPHVVVIFAETSEDLPENICIAGGVGLSLGVVAPDAPVSFEIENSRISKIIIDLKEAREDVEVIFEKLEEKPPELPDPPGLVWAYHQIDVNVPEEAIENAGINFWVLKEWLATHGVSKENIVLLRFHEGGWEELPTEILGENVTHVSYKASTGGFSLFAITGYGAEEVPEEEKPVGIDPILLGTVIGVIAVVALTVLLRRRKRVVA